MAFKFDSSDSTGRNISALLVKVSTAFLVLSKRLEGEYYCKIYQAHSFFLTSCLLEFEWHSYTCSIELNIHIGTMYLHAYDSKLIPLYHQPPMVRLLDIHVVKYLLSCI